jgi:RNA polymerase sigma-70 factor (ECF subfamily)
MEYNLNTIDKNIRSGDKQAYNFLFHAFYKRLCCYADSFLFNFEVSKDIVQDVYLNLWEKRTKLPESIFMESYLFRSVKNRCIDYKKRLNIDEAYNLHILKAMHNELYEDHTCQINELKELINLTINKLPPTTKKIFLLVKETTYKQREVADLLGVSLKTIEKHVALAKKELEKILNNYFLS